MENNSWKIKRKKTFNPPITINSNRKNNIRKEFYSFLIDSEKNNSKKVIDFPLSLTLFVKNQEKNQNKTEKSKKNIFNIKFPSLKPKNLNVKKLKIEDFIKLNESNSVSRNLNFLSNSNSKILNVDSFNSSRITHFKKLVDTMKSPRIRLKNINFSPLNISTKNSPIIINQIGLDNSSTTKINNLSNNSIENELSFIKNLKNTSFKNISHHNINFKDKKIPPILLSPSKKINVFKKSNVTKLNLKEIKKLVKNQIDNFEDEKKSKKIKDNIIKKFKDNNINYKNINDIKNNNDNEIKEKDITENKNNNTMAEINDNKKNNSMAEINENKNNNSMAENNENKNNKDKLNFNFKLFKDQILKRNSLNLINFRNSLFKKENNDENNNDKNDNIAILRKNSSIIFNQKKLYSEINKFINNENGDIKKLDMKKNKKEKKSNKKTPSFKKKGNSSKRKATLNSEIEGGIFYYLNIKKTKENKFLEKLNRNNKSIFKVQNSQALFQKSNLLLNMKTKLMQYNIKKKNISEITEQIFNKYEFNSEKGIYFKQITKREGNKYYTILYDQKNIQIDNNCSITNILSGHIIASYEFMGISSSVGLNSKRRNGKIFDIKKTNKTIRYANLLEGKFLKNEEESFKRTKSNVFQHEFNNGNLMYYSKNIISISEIILKENTYIYNKGIKFNKNLNKQQIRKSISLVDPRTPIKNESAKKTLSHKSSLKTLRILKRKTKHSYKMGVSRKYSILYMKNFFNRENKNRNKKNIRKDEKKLSSISELSSPYSTNNIAIYSSQDNYYILLDCIMKGLHSNFINIFKKVEKNLDINQKIYQGNTLLIYSSKEGNFTITKYLCSQGADVNIQNDRGNTALHYAISYKFFSIVDLLKSFGAKEDIMNKKGFSPWDCIEHTLE